MNSVDESDMNIETSWKDPKVWSVEGQKMQEKAWITGTDVYAMYKEKQEYVSGVQTRAKFLSFEKQNDG